jgi:hypothetical protein
MKGLNLTTRQLNNLVKLIEVGGASGVKTLNLGELTIDYKNGAVVLQEKDPPQKATTDPVEQIVEDPNGILVDDEFKKYNEELFLEEEFRNLILENPLAYEEYLATGKMNEFGQPSAGTIPIR